ncbi:MAG: pyocin knob domain-containing protein [Muribaculaceae bacterium]|nr:pyocin knob domain-containing protein [Muribaculaceae bacterium]
MSLSAQFAWDVQHASQSPGILWFRTKDSTSGWRPFGRLAFITDNVASATNADKLDGLHASAFTRCDQAPAVDLDTVNGVGFIVNPLNANATEARHYPIQEAGCLIYCTAAYSSANQIYGSYSSNRWFARGGGGSATSKKAWREFAFLDSKVAAATVADKVGTATEGSAAPPVYINAGVPTACTAASVFSALSMNASKQLSLTVAGQNRTLTLTYAQSSDVLNVIDSRSVNDTFDSMAVQSMGCSMKQNGAVGLPASNAYSAVMHIKPWKDTSAGCAHQLAFNSSTYWLYHRMLLPNDISDWARLAEFVNGRLYLDENRTVYLYYDSAADCVRCNKTIVSNQNVAAFA